MERARHRRLKEYVADHFQAAGWTVKTEASGAGWRADVLVSNGERQAAFEIELSNPSVKSMTERQARYDQAGVTVIWLIKHEPRGGESSLDLPYFVLGRKTSGEPEVQIGYHHYPLSSLLQGLIDGRLHWRSQVLDPYRCGYLITFDSDCWYCDKTFTAIRGLQVPTCQCGRESESPADLNQSVFEAAFQQGLREGSLQPLSGPLAQMRFRGTKIRPEPYWANHCPHCRKVQGDFYLDMPAGHVFHYREGGTCTPVYTPSSVFNDYWDDLRSEGIPVGQAKHWCLVPEDPRGLVKKARPFLGPNREPVSAWPED